MAIKANIGEPEAIFFKLSGTGLAKQWNAGAGTAMPGRKGISAIFSRLNLLYGEN
jgi:hypothetical protein